MYSIIAAKEQLWCMLWRQIKTIHKSHLNSNKSFNIQQYLIPECIYDFPVSVRPIVFYFCNIGKKKKKKEIRGPSADGMDYVMPTEIALVSGNISWL